MPSADMERKAPNRRKLPVASQVPKDHRSTQSEPVEKPTADEEPAMIKTENAFKGLSIASKYREHLEAQPSKQKPSLEDVLAENEKLKEQLELTKQCWDMNKRVLESKVKGLEDKLKEVLEKGVIKLEEEIENGVRASNLDIEARRYEQLCKEAKEELRISRPLLEVGAAVRHHFLEKSRRKLAIWYGSQALYTADVGIRATGHAAENDPNAKADLALYQCGFLDANNREQAKMFVELYKADIRYAMEQRLFESRSQVQLWNLRGALFSSTKSRLGDGIPFFDPKPYIDAFLKLDQEITFLCPKMVDEGKPLYEDGEDPAEDPNVWEKILEAKKILGVLGVKDA